MDRYTLSTCVLVLIFKNVLSIVDVRVRSNTTLEYIPQTSSFQSRRDRELVTDHSFVDCVESKNFAPCLSCYDPNFWVRPWNCWISHVRNWQPQKSHWSKMLSIAISDDLSSDVEERFSVPSLFSNRTSEPSPWSNVRYSDLLEVQPRPEFDGRDVLASQNVWVRVVRSYLYLFVIFIVIVNTRMRRLRTTPLHQQCLGQSVTTTLGRVHETT